MDSCAWGRLIEEHTDLQARVQRLQDYLSTEFFQNLDDIDQRDLSEQLEYMNAYLSVLVRRSVRQLDSS